MTNKNAIVILANNYDFLEVQVRNLPKLEADYIICSETRIGTDLNKIRDIVGKDTILIDSREVVDQFSKICNTEFLHSYTMGMNILLQWYMFTFFDYDKVLFTEEDVILTEKVNDIFKENHNLFYTWTMSSKAANYSRMRKSTRELIDEWDKIFNLGFNEETYKDLWINTHISSGQRMYVRDKFDIELYKDYLIQFFESKVFEDRWLNRKTHRTNYLDERFEGFFAYKAGILNSDIAKYTYLEIAKPEKVNIAKYNKIEKCKGIWHNATVGQKEKWYKALKEHDKIK